MATLKKERARKPIADGSGCYASEGYKGGASTFRLTLFGPGPSPHYEIELTRSEMLSIAAEWIKIEARNAAIKEKADAKARSEAALS
jgi:hypothetical protein